MKKRGFTLIELLVVIAIIGILASIVLVSLSSARTKAKDVKIQSQTSGLRSAAEMYYGDNNLKYQAGTVAIAACPFASGSTSFLDNTSTAWPLIAAIERDLALTGADTGKFDCGITAAGDAWSVAVKLASTGKYFCVDSTGVAKGTQANGSIDYTAVIGAGTAAHTAAGATVCN